MPSDADTVSIEDRWNDTGSEPYFSAFARLLASFSLKPDCEPPVIWMFLPSTPLVDGLDSTTPSRVIASGCMLLLNSFDDTCSTFETAESLKVTSTSH